MHDDITDDFELPPSEIETLRLELEEANNRIRSQAYLLNAVVEQSLKQSPEGQYWIKSAQEAIARSKRPLLGSEEEARSRKMKHNGRIILYGLMLPNLIEAAYKCGYALALHGSLQRDLDLIAVPWVQTATPVEILLERLSDALGNYFPTGVDAGWKFGKAHFKPHGRRAFTLSFGADVFIDLSVMPCIYEACQKGPSAECL